MAGVQQGRSRKGVESRVPDFETIEAAAAFWDQHSLAELEDQSELATEVRFVPGGPKKSLTLRLTLRELDALATTAHGLGVVTSALARLWIFERLRQEGAYPPDKQKKNEGSTGC